ncbi:Alanine racemase 1 [bacterium HR30]|nr:Alanine racemase 1 [bacterium HR30]
MMSVEEVHTACAATDRAALCHNLGLLRSRLQRGTRLLAVVKADAYGHGLALVAPVLARAGVDAFGVATVSEGAELRALGLQQPVLVLCGAHGSELKTAAQERLAVALLDREHLQEIEQTNLPQRLAVHIKVDTGMGRLGTTPEALHDLLEDLGGARNIIVAGVFSHFGNADRVDTEFCQGQLRRFREVVGWVKQRWPSCVVHLANSAGTWSEPESHLDMVRPGLLLYGVSPGSNLDCEDFRPVMRFTAPVIQVREVPAGRPLGYGQTYITRRITRVAVLGVGYADGYDRRLSNVGTVGIRGHTVPVVGRVSMDATLVDVTDVPAVRVGDHALLWGELDGMRIPVEEVASRAGTIPYEMLTRLGRRVRRCWQESATTYSMDGPAIARRIDHG